nr:MAG TPA: hypothetical protein [Caudoviricetes sp.]
MRICVLENKKETQKLFFLLIYSIYTKLKSRRIFDLSIMIFIER